MEAIFALILLVLGWIWTLISFVIKVCIYVVYFLPILAARIMDWLNFWPHIWPFSGFY